MKTGLPPEGTYRRYCYDELKKAANVFYARLRELALAVDKSKNAPIDAIDCGLNVATSMIAQLIEMGSDTKESKDRVTIMVFKAILEDREQLSGVVNAIIEQGRRLEEENKNKIQ